MKTFYDFTSNELRLALCDFLGRPTDEFIFFTFKNENTIYVFFKKQWIQVFFDQIRICLESANHKTKRTFRNLKINLLN